MAEHRFLMTSTRSPQPAYASNPNKDTGCSSQGRVTRKRNAAYRRLSRFTMSNSRQRVLDAGTPFNVIHMSTHIVISLPNEQWRKHRKPTVHLEVAACIRRFMGNARFARRLIMGFLQKFLSDLHLKIES